MDFYAARILCPLPSRCTATLAIVTGMCFSILSLVHTVCYTFFHSLPLPISLSLPLHFRVLFLVRPNIVIGQNIFPKCLGKICLINFGWRYFENLHCKGVIEENPFILRVEKNRKQKKWHSNQFEQRKCVRTFVKSVIAGPRYTFCSWSKEKFARNYIFSMNIISVNSISSLSPLNNEI